MFSLMHYLMNGDYYSAVMFVLSSCFVVFCCLPIHEYAHGLVAYKLGDDTAKQQGRLTLNPLSHLNVLGTIMIFLFGIGYANPVPINPYKFKKGKMKNGIALTALAGPLSNIIMAGISVSFSHIFMFIGIKAGSNVVIEAIITFFSYAATINISLAVFNLLPIPPLDGSRIIGCFLSDKAYYNYMKYERYIMYGLMAVLLLGFLDRPIAFLSRQLFRLLCIIPEFILNLLV